MKIWKSKDILGIISCIIGTIWLALIIISVEFFPSNPSLTYPLVYFSAGAGTLALGILGTLKGSKIAIGGIFLGSFIIWAVIRLSYQL